MTQLFEELFNAWCVSYDPGQTPSHLRSNPVRAYGQYTFEVGFKLALQLAVSSLDPEMLIKLI